MSQVQSLSRKDIAEEVTEIGFIGSASHLLVTDLRPKEGESRWTPRCPVSDLPCVPEPSPTPPRISQVSGDSHDERPIQPPATPNSVTATAQLTHLSAPTPARSIRNALPASIFNFGKHSASHGLPVSLAKQQASPRTDQSPSIERSVSTATPMTSDRVDFFGGGAMELRNSSYGPLCHAWSQSTVATDAPPKYHRRSRSAVNVAKPASRSALFCNSILSLQMFQGVMLFLTFVVLFGGDLVQSLADVGFDRIYTVLLYLCLACFVMEWSLNIAASSLQSPVYTGSLFFFLDFIAILSIVIDILLIEASNMADDGIVARAARAARIGTRAGRSVRLMRLMRFLRLVRITRMLKAYLAQRERRRSKRSEAMEDELDFAATRADSIGSQIGASTTRKVVIMTLMLLILLPLLERDHNFQTCNAEMVKAMDSLFVSDKIQRNCTNLLAEVDTWFLHPTNVVGFSQHEDRGLTRNGLMYVVVQNCVLYVDHDLMGWPVSLQHLADKRRSTEIQVVPCNLEWRLYGGSSGSYFLYDFSIESKEEAYFSLGLTLVVIVALLAFSTLFSTDAEVIVNELVVPISQLMKDMSFTSKLELDKVTSEEDMFVSNIYEIQRLQGAFLTLRGAVASFSRFTPLEVVRHFLSAGQEARLGVAQRNVSIFFSDIAGFTTICESMPPIQVLSLLSEYFESMVSIIVEEQGTMLEFIGDAILAIWNAPSDVPDHAVRAVTAAVRMNRVLDGLRLKWAEEGKPKIRIRVGVHSADVYVGNLGSIQRMKYGVLGDGVNLASRLEDLNKRYATEVLISEEALIQQGVADAFVVRPIDLVVVKGRTKPTKIYEVIGLKESATEEMRSIASTATGAVKAYMQRDFGEAIRLFKLVQETKGDTDRASEVLVKRCRRFIDEPPQENWDGSEVLTEKKF